MTPGIHPAASGHLPFFLPSADGRDVLLTIMAYFLVAAVLGAGLLFLRLHSLPERLAHKSQKLQFEIVAVLGLISLFTHEHIFWVAGLLLALIEFPDFSTPIGRIASALERMAHRERSDEPHPRPVQPVAVEPVREMDHA